MYQNPVNLSGIVSININCQKNFHSTSDFQTRFSKCIGNASQLTSFYMSVTLAW